jgi:hypothetical protein
MQLTFGNLPGGASPFLFIATGAPTYYRGFGVRLGMLCITHRRSFFHALLLQ